MRYWHSDIGSKKYEEIGLKYPTHPFDGAYSAFKRKTKSSTDNQFIINKMIRLQIQETDENTQEYILYDLQEIRKDGLGNPKKFTRTNLGIYPIPQRTVVRTFDEDNQPIIKTEGISEVNDGYEFPFTVEKADELHKWCKDKITATNSKKTEYLVQKIGEMKISVDSFKSWRNGEFETLYATGNAEGIETPVVRPKPIKKSKEKEQSDLQREILRKPYTTTIIKPKEVEKQQEEDKVVTAAEASVVV